MQASSREGLKLILSVCIVAQALPAQHTHKLVQSSELTSCQFISHSLESLVIALKSTSANRELFTRAANRFSLHFDKSSAAISASRTLPPPSPSPAPAPAPAPAPVATQSSLFSFRSTNLLLIRASCECWDSSTCVFRLCRIERQANGSFGGAGKGREGFASDASDAVSPARHEKKRALRARRALKDADSLVFVAAERGESTC